MEKIVLVDDDADIRRVVELRLRLAGFQVLTASDGEAGLQLIRAEKPRGATAPDIAPPRRLAVIQFSVAPSFSKADIHASQAALFVNPCPTSKERLAHSHTRPQPADFRNSAMDVRDEPREVAMCSFTAAE